MYELGKLLKRLRGKLSLREVAKRSGLSYTYIRSLELGKHPKTGAPINPTPDILRSLAKAYNYPHEELMKLAGYIDEVNERESNITYEEQKNLLVIKELAEKYGFDISDPKSIELLDDFLRMTNKFKKD